MAHTGGMWPWEPPAPLPPDVGSLACAQEESNRVYLGVSSSLHSQELGRALGWAPGLGWPCSSSFSSGCCNDTPVVREAALGRQCLHHSAVKQEQSWALFKSFEGDWACQSPWVTHRSCCQPQVTLDKLILVFDSSGLCLHSGSARMLQRFYPKSSHVNKQG